MSRRREERPTRWVVGSVYIQVICSGRGRHNVVNFGRVSVLPSGRVNTHGFLVGEHLVDPGVPDGWHKTYPLTCRRCTPTRNVPLTEERLKLVCVQLAEAGVSRLDISAMHALPC